LYINVLNYRHFHTDCSTFLKIKIVGKLKKNVKKRFYRKIKTFINVYYNYARQHLDTVLAVAMTVGVSRWFSVWERQRHWCQEQIHDARIRNSSLQKLALQVTQITHLPYR